MSVRLNNLRKYFDMATTEEHFEGIHAYERYHLTLRQLAEYYNAPFVQTVEAFAALSPNNDYIGNLRSLVSCLRFWNTHGPRSVECIEKDWPVVSTYKGCRDRALSYLCGEASFLDTVKGLKITAFRHNLLYPMHSNEVTIDGHILLASRDSSGTMKSAQFSMSPSVYKELTKDIRRIARLKNLRPHQVQATIWIARKRIYGVKDESQTTLFGDNTNLNKCYIPPHEIEPFKKVEDTKNG